MATGHGSEGYFASTIERTDTCNEILKKCVDFNLQSMLIDEQLEKMVQECNERDYASVWFLKSGIEHLRKDQESMKGELRRMLMRFFPSESSAICNLEGFLLEQEVYTLMSTKSDRELNSFMRNIERCFTRSMAERNVKINYFKRELDQLPKKLTANSNIGHSGDKNQSCQPQEFKNRSIGDMPMSLSDVIVEIYGFSRDVALDIQECLTSRKLVSEAFKNDSLSDDLDRKGNGFDPDNYLDHQVLSEECEKEDAETLKRKSVTIAKEKFQDLLNTFEDDMQIDSGSGYCDENTLKAMKYWIFSIESVFCDLLYDFYTMMSGYEQAVIKFRKFISVLEGFKKRHDGMVPITVYKILAMPIITYEGEEGDKEALYKEIEFDIVMIRIQKVILSLRYVLGNTLGHLNAQTMNNSVLTSFQTILNLSEEFLKEIAMKINGAKSWLAKTAS